MSTLNLATPLTVASMESMVGRASAPGKTAPGVERGPVVLLLARGAARQRASGELLDRAGAMTVVSDADAGRVVGELALVRPAIVIVDAASYADGGLSLLRQLQIAGLVTPLALLAPPPPSPAELTVAALHLGADDVLAATIGDQELRARLLSLQRRGQRREDGSSGIIRFSDVELDIPARAVRRAGQWLDLAPRVLDLLVALAERAPMVVSRAELLRDVWGYDPSAVTRTVDTHVRMLRRAVEPEPSRPRHIRTVLKVGYRFTP